MCEWRQDFAVPNKAGGILGQRRTSFHIEIATLRHVCRTGRAARHQHRSMWCQGLRERRDGRQSGPDGRGLGIEGSSEGPPATQDAVSGAPMPARESRSGLGVPASVVALNHVRSSATAVYSKGATSSAGQQRTDGGTLAGHVCCDRCLSAVRVRWSFSKYAATARGVSLSGVFCHCKPKVEFGFRSFSTSREDLAAARGRPACELPAPPPFPMHRYF